MKPRRWATYQDALALLDTLSPTEDARAFRLVAQLYKVSVDQLLKDLLEVPRPALLSEDLPLSY